MGGNFFKENNTDTFFSSKFSVFLYRLLQGSVTKGNLTGLEGREKLPSLKSQPLVSVCT